MKTLLIVSPEMRVRHDDAQRRREHNDESPRVSLLEDTLHADVMDRVYLESLSRIRRILYRPFPSTVIQTIETFRLRQRYDVVVTWDDRVALMYAAVLRLTRARAPRHIAVVTWMAPAKKGLALKLVQQRIDRIIVWGAFQKDLLVEIFGIPWSKVIDTGYFVDQTFFRPYMDVPTDTICSVGNSKRDYPTLVEAMRGLPITCHIVTQAKPSAGKTSDWGITSRALGEVRNQPDNVVMETATFTELRMRYARSRFVVVPLFRSLGDYGITSIAEGMAMGKAIICSNIRGLPDFFEHGVTGLVVPPGDPRALREAIEYLWEHPDEAARMGAEGRRRAEEIIGLDHFVASVRQVVEEALGESAMRRPAPERRSGVRVIGPETEQAHTSSSR